VSQFDVFLFKIAFTMMQSNGHYPVQGNLKSILVPVASLMLLLLVSNTNLYSISHRFQVIADYWSNFRC